MYKSHFRDVKCISIQRQCLQPIQSCHGCAHSWDECVGTFEILFFHLHVCTYLVHQCNPKHIHVQLQLSLFLHFVYHTMVVPTTTSTLLSRSVLRQVTRIHNNEGELQGELLLRGVRIGCARNCAPAPSCCPSRLRPVAGAIAQTSGAQTPPLSIASGIYHRHLRRCHVQPLRFFRCRRFVPPDVMCISSASTFYLQQLNLVTTVLPHHFIMATPCSLQSLNPPGTERLVCH